MATVYLAEEPRHSRHLALKVYTHDWPRVWVQIASYGRSRPPPVSAIRIFYPCLTQVKPDGFLFYAMPYVEGESLRIRLNRKRQLSVDDAIRITREVADALGFAHTRGVVHRGITGKHSPRGWACSSV